MYPTGKMYGLNVTSYVDERSDPIKSTIAASKYLAKLYEIFGDWDLALAAYNSGPGNVNKAIRRSGGYQNYWNLRPHLPRETAGYLPAFLATMYIFEYAEEHGFKKASSQYRYMETDTIHVKHTISLDQVAELMELPIEELQFLKSFGIEVEVSPGISSAIAVSASQGIPVTRRDYAESFWVVTATTKNGAFTKDLHLAAASSATIVILMGLRKLPLIVAAFMKEGKHYRPWRSVQNGTLPNEKTVISTVSSIESAAELSSIGTPATIVIGTVVSLHPSFVKTLAETMA